MPRCKRAGSFRVCLSFDKGNEAHAITVRRPGTFSTDEETYRFLFDNGKQARSWFKELRGTTDIEDLRRVAHSSGTGIEETET